MLRIRKAYIIGALAIGLAAVGFHSTPAYRQLTETAVSLQQYWNHLNTADNSLSPLERLVFGFVLSNSKSTHPGAQTTAPARRG